MDLAGHERGILCVCSENTVRSVMLEAILTRVLDAPVASAGIKPAPFCDMMVEAFLRGKGYDIPAHDPHSFHDTDTELYGLWIALSRTAYDVLRADPSKPDLEYWEIPAPLPLGEAPRDMLEARLEEIWSALCLHVSNRFRVSIN